jgi:hypothetical protein
MIDRKYEYNLQILNSRIAFSERAITAPLEGGRSGKKMSKIKTV